MELIVEAEKGQLIEPSGKKKKIAGKLWPLVVKHCNGKNILVT